MIIVALPLVLAIISCSACESPTGPSPFADADAPDVAGTYSGSITLTITDAPGYAPMRGDSTLVVIVTQVGHEVTLTGTQAWPGESPILIWDGVMGTIDAIGIFTGPALRDSTDLECGRVRYRSRRLRFSVGTLSYSLVADTDRCGRFEYRGTLTRL